MVAKKVLCSFTLKERQENALYKTFAAIHFEHCSAFDHNFNNQVLNICIIFKMFLNGV